MNLIFDLGIKLLYIWWPVLLPILVGVGVLAWFEAGQPARRDLP